MEPTTRVELVTCRLRIGELYIEALNLNDLGLRKQAQNGGEWLPFRTPGAPNQDRRTDKSMRLEILWQP